VPRLLRKKRATKAQANAINTTPAMQSDDPCHNVTPATQNIDRCSAPMLCLAASAEL